MFSQLACWGTWWNSNRRSTMAPRKGERSLSSLERAGEVRRQIVQNDPDALGPTSVSSRMQTAKSSAARRSVTLTSIATPTHDSHLTDLEEICSDVGGHSWTDVVERAAARPALTH